VDGARAVLDADLAGKTDDALAAELRRLHEHLVQLKASRDEIVIEQASVKDSIRTTREVMQATGGRSPLTSWRQVEYRRCGSA